MKAKHFITINICSMRACMCLIQISNGKSVMLTREKMEDEYENDDEEMQIFHRSGFNVSLPCTFNTKTVLFSSYFFACFLLFVCDSTDMIYGKKRFPFY